MAEHDVGASLVMEDGHLAGMFFEHDYVRKFIHNGRTSLATTVREIMSDIVARNKASKTAWS